MVVNKRWNIGDNEYLLSQDISQNKISLHINSYNYSDKVPKTIFKAYDFIFNELGSFKFIPIDGIIRIIILDSEWECEIDIFSYTLFIINRNDGLMVKKYKGYNIYDCFDALLLMLEEE